jgi:RimJ/RimL family protein N-acetyltransferase
MSAAHTEDIARMLADPHVGATMGGVRDRAYVQELILRHARRWDDDGFGLWAAYSLADGGFVGRGGVQRTMLEGTPVVEVGWCLPPGRWGQGYASEIGRAGLTAAFEEQGLREVVAFTQPHNTRSLAVMARLGMTYVRECRFADLDHVLYVGVPP